ncbi:hypothetical protein EXIGLDRAFT_717250 [Exidia glandulosa HHB12029]|uniref:Uncharacterized protein n=1 Tax=Exidia glandulosa HHB12029 TaxID=1314781 RepID=A0A165P5I4_EXIGL|nr:hypothetical protein EXIGLDRAFT_717250 [Exidia glandulosa HHB12029]
MKIDALKKKLPPRVRTVDERGHNPREDADVDAYLRLSTGVCGCSYYEIIDC